MKGGVNLHNIGHIIEQCKELYKLFTEKKDIVEKAIILEQLKSFATDDKYSESQEIVLEYAKALSGFAFKQLREEKDI